MKSGSEFSVSSLLLERCDCFTGVEPPSPVDPLPPECKLLIELRRLDRPDAEFVRVVVERVRELAVEAMRNAVQEGDARTGTVPPRPRAENLLEPELCRVHCHATIVVVLSDAAGSASITRRSSGQSATGAKSATPLLAPSFAWPQPPEPCAEANRLTDDG